MTDKEKPDENGKAVESDEKATKPVDKTPPAPIETHHELKLGKKSLKYTVNTGMLPINNDKDEHEANIFFMAYTLDDVADRANRPLTFVFNGGPGSASVWLHLGAVGPKRVKMHDEGWMPQPPYRLEDNPQTWLDITDLVFIDPVGTGYSHPLKKEDGKNYWGVEKDLTAVGKFIRLYLNRYQRWTSPLFLAGESYGTFRSAGLAGHLIDHGVAFNGIILISTVVNLQTLVFTRGNELPNNLYIPTYAATAWYHGKLPKRLQEKPLRAVLDEVEAWTTNEYTVALLKGDGISKKERAAIAEKLAEYTGLDKKYIERSQLRIDIWRFCRELMREEDKTVGRLDSRFTVTEELAITEFPEIDPAMTAIMPPYTATFNQYVREELGYETDADYITLGYEVNSNWEWGKEGYADTSEHLRKAFKRNPHMKVFVGQGYYDLATPHFAAEYSMNHMGIAPETHDNISFYYYHAGHMYYLDVKSLKKMKTDTATFIKAALPN